MILAATILLGLFIAWIVFLADTGRNCIFFEWVKAVPLGDKIGHFFLFGCLALGATLVSGTKGMRAGHWLVPFGAILVFLLAAGEEASQYFFATRTCDITDLMADVAGIVAFSALGILLGARWRKRDTGHPLWRT